MRKGTNVNVRMLLACARLTERQQFCLALYYFDGLTQQEIGLRLGITHQAVSCHLLAGKKRLAEAGLSVRRLRRSSDVLECPTDPALLDRLGPRDLQALW